jgi:sulfonate transport system substrate-binding protein
VIAKQSGVYLAIQRILAGHGMGARDVRAIDMDGAAVSQALAAGTVDAAFGGSSLLLMQDQGLVRVVYSTKQGSPTYRRQYHVLVTREFEQAHPAWVQRVVNVLVDAAAWASDERNRERLFELWGKSGVPASNFKAEFAGDALEVRNSPLFDPFMTGRYQAAVADAVRFGLIAAPFDVEAWIDRGYLARALAARRLEQRWPLFDAQGRPLRRAPPGLTQAR